MRDKIPGDSLRPNIPSLYNTENYKSPSLSFRIIGRTPFSAHDDPEKLKKALGVYAASVLGISTFFWIWAIYNTYHLSRSGGFDLGIFSFFGSGMSSALLSYRVKLCGCGICEEQYSGKSDEVGVYSMRRSNKSIDYNALHHFPPDQVLSAFTVLSQLIVVANYLLGILFACTAGPHIYVYFATYCTVFAFLWLLVARIGWSLTCAYRGAVRRVYGDDTSTNRPSSLSSIMSRAVFALTDLRNVQSSYDDENEDTVNEELRSLYEGSGGYSNI